MTIRTYAVSGLSCGRCVDAVHAEVAKVDGVVDVLADLVTQTVTVAGDDVDDGRVRTAIGAAGYTVVG